MLKVRYACLMRPHAPGTIPKDGITGIFYEEGSTMDGHHHWGHVEYNRRLTDQEVDDYELLYISTVDE